MTERKILLGIDLTNNFRMALSTDFVDSQHIVVKTQTEESSSSKDQKEGVHKFQFDRIFNPDESQASIYEYSGKPVVQSTFI